MKHGHAVIQLADEEFCLLPQRAVYRPNLRQLILCDLHLGKASHFRKQGIALPVQSYLKDFEILYDLLNAWQPESVLFLGDLFHSGYNREWLTFQSFLGEYPDVQFVLIQGNHDILTEKEYSLPNLRKMAWIEEEQYIFSHYPLQQKEKINFCGHIHPGIQLTGIARQSLTLPCFYFNGIQFILPAFGALTGLTVLGRERNAVYYVITDRSVLKV